jgi:hypothetical protein
VDRAYARERESAGARETPPSIIDADPFWLNRAGVATTKSMARGADRVGFLR